MLNRMLLSTRYRMIPGLCTATIFRKSSSDVATDGRDVNFVEFKAPKSTGGGSELGATRSENATICLWVNELAGWIVEEYDIVHVVNAEQLIDSWWLVSTATLEMMGTRYRCDCVATVAVD